DVERVAAFLGGAPIVRSEGESFPVAVQYVPPRPGQPPEVAVPAALRRAKGDSDGDILVFLPGIGEINRVATDVARMDELSEFEVHTLHSSTPPAAQDAAVRPAVEGVRRIILATSIAE